MLRSTTGRLGSHPKRGYFPPPAPPLPHGKSICVEGSGVPESPPRSPSQTNSVPDLLRELERLEGNFVQYCLALPELDLIKRQAWPTEEHQQREVQILKHWSETTQQGQDLLLRIHTYLRKGPENDVGYQDAFACLTKSQKWGIHFTQVTPTSCGWAHGASASQSATIDRYGVGSTATACCTRR